MPRKQRFKPSRKPKSEAPQTEPRNSPVENDGTQGHGDGHEPQRDDNRGVIEAVGESA